PRRRAMTADDTVPTPDASGTDAAPPRGLDGDLPTVLIDQIEFHVRAMLRPRLEGLTDEEYFFDPSGDQKAWTVHRRLPEEDLPEGAFQAGTGEWVIDFAHPEPEPAPLTTIAWRLGHLIVGVLAVRSHSHHGGPPADYMTWQYAPTAKAAPAQLGREYGR